MNSRRTTRYAIGVSVAGVLVLLAAFMPWGEISSTPTANISNGLFEMSFQGMSVTLTLTAWNSIARLVGFAIPNWIVVTFAGGAVLLSWLKARSIWKPNLAVWCALPTCGIVYVFFVLINLLGASQTKAGIGIFLTLFAFIGMLIAMGKQWDIPESQQ